MRNISNTINRTCIRVQNYRSAETGGAARTLRFGACAINAFFVGLGSLLGTKKPVRVTIDGKNISPITSTMERIKTMPDADYAAVVRLGDFIIKDTSMLFGGQFNKNHLYLYISHILFNSQQAGSIKKQVDSLFMGRQIHIVDSIATRFINPSNSQSGTRPAIKTPLTSDLLAQIVEAAESIGHSLKYIETRRSEPGLFGRPNYNWSSLGKMAVDSLGALFNGPAGKYSSVPSDSSARWRDLQSFFNSSRQNNKSLC